MNRDSVIIYKSFVDAIRELPDEYRAQAYDALFAYALNGEMYTGDNCIIKAVMLLVAPQIEANNKRYENGKKGGRPAKETEGEPSENQTITEPKPKHNQTETETEPNVNVNVNDNVNVNEKEITRKKRVRFTPPSVEEIAEYCKERGNGIDPSAFYNFYASKNWNVGKTKMSDWRAAVRTWELRRKEETRNNVSRFQQRERPGDGIKVIEM